MMLNNQFLDVEYVRDQFPAFKNDLSKKWTFFENAGGSYVPSKVVNKLNEFMVGTKVQPYAEFDTSKIAGQNMDIGMNNFSEMINADSNEILIGGSTTINMYVLSNAFKKLIKIGDEIIVTNQDHEANIGAWRKLSECGAIIKEWKLNSENGELEIDELKNLITDKTKILAVTHCSNIVGSFNDLKLITKIAHEKNIIVVGDGVSFAPHGFPDVKDLDVDFYAFSLYKTYGPHLALLYGKRKILEMLPNQNHEFLKDEIPYTLNPGGPNHEETACLIGISEYFDDLYNHHFEKKETIRRNRIKKVNDLISEHEKKIGNILLDYLNSERKIKIIGKKRINNDRAPTFSFLVEGMSSLEFSNKLVKRGIATRNGEFYAWRCLKALGIDTTDGVVRVSMVHYNNEDDVKNLIRSIEASI